MRRRTNGVLLGAFVAEMKASGVSPDKVAKRMLVHRPTLLDWIAEKKKPSAFHRRVIERVTDGRVPFDGWPCSKQEKAQLEKVEALRPSQGAA